MKEHELIWSENFIEAERLLKFLVFKRGWEIIRIHRDEN